MRKCELKLCEMRNKADDGDDDFCLDGDDDTEDVEAYPTNPFDI